MEGKSVERNRYIEIGILISGALSFFTCFALSLGVFNQGEPLVGTFYWDSLWNFYFDLIYATPCLSFANTALGLIALITGWVALKSRKGRITKRAAIAAIFLGSTGVIANLFAFIALLYS